MVKRRTRKKSTRRRPSYSRRFRRRVSRAKIPLLPTVGLAAGTLAGQSGGWASPLQGFQQGNFGLAIQSVVRNLTGMRVGIPDTGYTEGFEWDIMKTLNPFDMTEATGLKGLFWGSIASMGMRLLGINRKFTAATKKIPFLNKFSL